MARLLADKKNVQAPDSDFPFGRIKDNDGSNNGTPVDEDVYGDFHQFFEKLMSAAGITANKLPDNDYSGFQLFEALEAVILTINGGLKRKIVEIGDWNMVSTPQVNVAHGLTFSKIRNVSAFILNDAATNLTNLLVGFQSPGSVDGHIQVSSANVSLIRLVSGFFDNTNYDSTSFNRGYIVIDFIP